MTDGEDGITSVHDGEGDGLSGGHQAGAATSRPGGLTKRAPGDNALSIQDSSILAEGDGLSGGHQAGAATSRPGGLNTRPPGDDALSIQGSSILAEGDGLSGGHEAGPATSRPGGLTTRPPGDDALSIQATEVTPPWKPQQSQARTTSPVSVIIPTPHLQLEKKVTTATTVAGNSARAPVVPSTGHGASSSTEKRDDSVSTAQDHTGKGSLELSICINEGRRPKRKRISDRKPWILCLPDDLVEKVLVRHTMQADLNNVMASSFFFLRVALLRCPCNHLGRQPRLVAALVQAKSGLLKVAAPDGPRLRWLEPAANMLNRFLNMVFHSRGWLRPVDCREGTVAVIRDRQARVVELLRPFQGQKITTLPEAPCHIADELLTGGLIPGEAGAFKFFLLFRCRAQIEQLSLKTFSSVTGLWEVQQMNSPFVLSRSLAPRAVFASGRHYVLDHQNLKLLVVDMDRHMTDTIVLPADKVQNRLCHDNNTLAVSRGGELYWVMLDGFFFKFFILSSSGWVPRWKRMIPDHVPSNTHAVQLVGHAAISGVVLVRCSHQVFAIDIEEGSLVKFKDCRGVSYTVFSFEMIHHVIADHVRRM